MTDVAFFCSKIQQRYYFHPITFTTYVIFFRTYVPSSPVVAFSFLSLPMGQTGNTPPAMADMN